MKRGSEILAKVSWGPLSLSLCLAAPIIAAALFYVWTRVTTVRLGYALARGSSTQSRLLAQRDSLRLEVATLKSPDRLAVLAAERGLAPPSADQVLILSARSE